MGTDNGLNLDNLSTDSNNGKFLGVEAVYEWDRHRKYRLGGRLLTSLGVPSRTVTQYLAFFQIGFDVFDSKSEPVVNKTYEQVSESDLQKAESLTPREPVPMAPPQSPPSDSTQDMGYTEPAPDVMSTPAPPEETLEATPTPVPEMKSAEPPVAPGASVPAKKVVLSMGFNDLPFGSNDSRLPTAHQARVKNIGRYLGKNAKAWKKLMVSGHTDERGAAKFNANLSQMRAETVRRLLIEGGAPASKIKAVGLGEAKPIDKAHNEKAWARNRRVELEFLGVTDRNAIQHALDQ
jgi:peptidoglycan-associated lipoprotein